MQEIRLIDCEGKLAQTLEDKSLPAVPYELPPRSIVLADYCRDTEGNVWIKPEEYLQEEDLAAVVYSREGVIKRMVVAGEVVSSEREQTRFLRSLSECVVTRYPGVEEGDELFIYYLSERMEERLR